MFSLYINIMRQPCFADGITTNTTNIMLSTTTTNIMLYIVALGPRTKNIK